MSSRYGSFREQVQRNAVALISLVVALTTLTYSTWRNEKSEDNHNHRQAAFEMLLKLNELQRVVFHLRYDRDRDDLGNPRVGWTYVLTIQDLARICGEPVQREADELHAVWSANWDGLAHDQQRVDAVLASVDRVRESTLALLRALD